MDDRYADGSHVLAVVWMEGVMTDDMFLDSDEIRQLTKRIQRAAQAKVLSAMGIQHKRRPDGSVAVLRALVEKEFGLRGEKKSKADSYQPNWDAVNA